MKKFAARVLCAVAVFAAGAASLGCFIAIIDEPVAPKSLCD